MRNGKAAALAGLDIEMPFPMHYGRRLERLVRKGLVPLQIIDAAVLRILRQKIRFSRIGEAGGYRTEVVAGTAHRALARQAAEQSAVLLKNDLLDSKPLLPLDPLARKIAVLGRLADTPNTGDGGSSMVRPPQVITPLQGLRQRFPSLEIDYHDGSDLNKAVEAAHAADLVLLVVGYTHNDEGEFVNATPLVAKEKGGDRRSLTLSPADEALILQASRANPRCVVVMEGGSAIITEAWRECVPAILMLWYPGMEGGTALANLLAGDANPSGKLPCVFPRSPKQLPFFDADAREIEYDLYHGYRLMDKQKDIPAFAFGYGLSYTTFSLDRLQIREATIGVEGTLHASVHLKNTGNYAGAEVVQLYAGAGSSAYDRPVKELKGFRKVTLQAGEEQELTFDLSARSLALWDEGWKVEPGKYHLWIGTSSRAEDLLQASFQVR